jgi:hypothetical protein
LSYIARASAWFGFLCWGDFFSIFFLEQWSFYLLNRKWWVLIIEADGCREGVREVLEPRPLCAHTWVQSPWYLLAVRERFRVKLDVGAVVYLACLPIPDQESTAVLIRAKVDAYS